MSGGRWGPSGWVGRFGWAGSFGRRGRCGPSSRLRRDRGALVVVILGCSTACAGSGGALEEGARQPVAAICAPAEGELAPGASLAGMTGPYRLTLVREDDTTARVDGSLVLTSRAPDGTSLDGYATPLQGIADIELEGVGAHTAGSLGSTDPDAPGVLVLEADGSEPEILLRFGSTVNRTEPVAFDEAFTVLRVQGIEGGGFAGSWRSGMRATVAGGYFCAEPT